jgi:hypothetical protein
MSIIDRKRGSSMDKRPKTLVEIFASELPPADFSNAMNGIGRPVGIDYREAPEWRIWLAARKAENRQMEDDLKAAAERIERMRREIDGD